MVRQVGFLACSVPPEVVSRLGDRAPDVHVLAAPRLCEREARARSGAAKWSLEAAVIAPCGEPCWERLAAALSPLGAFSVHRVEAAGTDPRRFEALAWGKIRRARVSPPVPPEGVSYRLPFEASPVSRRDLLKWPVRRRAVPIPLLEASACRGREGCRRCVEACRFQAVAMEAGLPAVNRTRCEGCGSCATACPTSALRLPGFSLAEVLSEVEGVLSVPGGPRVVLFDCRTRAPDPVPAEVCRIALPCVGMLSLQWILATLAEGATAVVVLESLGRCARWHDGARPRLVVSIARQVLAGLGIPDERVAAIGSPSDLPGEVSRLVALPRFGDPLTRKPAEAPLSLAGTIRELAALGGGTALPVAGEALPFGTALVDRARCSLCGACATACPLGALAFSEDERGATLAFDAASCDGCRLCETCCPERALTIRRELRVEDLGERKRLHRGRVAKCLGCGEPLASANLLRAVRARLGENAEVARLLQHCPACRMAGGIEARRDQGEHQPAAR